MIAEVVLGRKSLRAFRLGRSPGRSPGALADDKSPTDRHAGDMRTPPANRPPDNIWFRLLIPAGFLFCATCLSWVMSAFGDQQAPVSRWLSRHAMTAILIEAAVIVVLSITAMAVDRRQSLATKKASLEPKRSSEAETGNLD